MGKDIVLFAINETDCLNLNEKFAFAKSTLDKKAKDFLRSLYLIHHANNPILSTVAEYSSTHRSFVNLSIVQ
jgi:hypothetical protein